MDTLVVIVKNNNVSFNISRYHYIDTNKLMINRIASQCNSLPEYIYFISGDIFRDQSVEIYDLLRLADGTLDGANLLLSLNLSTDLFSKLISIWKQKIAESYIELTFDTILEEYKKDPKDVYIHVNIDDENKKIVQFYKHTSKLTNILATIVNTPEKEASSLDKIVDINYYYFHYDYDLYSLFDKLETSSTFPIITYQNYYKIYKSIQVDKIAQSVKSSSRAITAIYYKENICTPLHILEKDGFMCIECPDTYIQDVEKLILLKQHEFQKVELSKIICSFDTLFYLSLIHI